MCVQIMVSAYKCIKVSAGLVKQFSGKFLHHTNLHRYTFTYQHLFKTPFKIIQIWGVFNNCYNFVPDKYTIVSNIGLSMGGFN